MLHHWPDIFHRVDWTHFLIAINTMYEYFVLFTILCYFAVPFVAFYSVLDIIILYVIFHGHCFKSPPFRYIW